MYKFLLPLIVIAGCGVLSGCGAKDDAAETTNSTPAPLKPDASQPASNQNPGTAGTPATPQ